MELRLSEIFLRSLGSVEVLGQASGELWRQLSRNGEQLDGAQAEERGLRLHVVALAVGQARYVVVVPLVVVFLALLRRRVAEALLGADVGLAHGVANADRPQRISPRIQRRLRAQCDAEEEVGYAGKDLDVLVLELAVGHGVSRVLDVGVDVVRQPVPDEVCLVEVLRHVFSAVRHHTAVAKGVLRSDLPSDSVGADLYTNGAVEIEHFAAALHLRELRREPAGVVVRKVAPVRSAGGRVLAERCAVRGIHLWVVAKRNLRVHCPRHHRRQRCQRALSVRGTVRLQHAHGAVHDQRVAVVAQAVPEVRLSPVQLRRLPRVQGLDGGVAHLLEEVAVIVVVDRRKAETTGVGALMVVLGVHDDVEVVECGLADRLLHHVVVLLQVVLEEHVDLH
mmetsp:Transcript_7205/g.30686  ORF Transcript_7205/g.30686 Transcript_7205/m.30686 type:complete len:393 (+) Transcript_7205:544-1722(+)